MTAPAGPGDPDQVALPDARTTSGSSRSRPTRYRRLRRAALTSSTSRSPTHPATTLWARRARLATYDEACTDCEVTVSQGQHRPVRSCPASSPVSYQEPDIDYADRGRLRRAAGGRGTPGCQRHHRQDRQHGRRLPTLPDAPGRPVRAQRGGLQRRRPRLVHAARPGASDDGRPAEHRQRGVPLPADVHPPTTSATWASPRTPRRPASGTAPPTTRTASRGSGASADLPRCGRRSRASAAAPFPTQESLHV